MITLKNRVQFDLERNIKLNLGCGADIMSGYHGIDMIDYGQDMVWDITKGLPLPDNSVIGLYSSHFIEHIENKDIDNLFYEIIRVCKDGTKVEFRCPHSDSVEAYFSGHVSLWDERRFRAVCLGLSNDSDRIVPDRFITNGMEITAILIVKKYGFN